MLEMPLLPLFQSTLSMRRATEVVAALVAKVFISIHALHEESDVTGGDARLLIVISIHALHEESDPVPLMLAGAAVYFNPRSP